MDTDENNAVVEIAKLNNLKHDKEITISIAPSRKSKKWRNKTMTVLDFARKLGQTIRTQETFAEYREMAKADQDQIKDVGGYVGGALKDGLRRKENVANRQILAYDIDYGVPDTIKRTKRALKNYSYTISSTHKHTSDKPRFRLIVYPDRPMLQDEFIAVARKVAGGIGMEAIDDGSYDLNRLLYWPSTSLDAEFFFYHNDKPFLPVDKVLESYGEGDAWRDAKNWPRSSREIGDLDRAMKRQADPLKKKGIIGAFCRTVPIVDAIELYLEGVYRREGADRYTFRAGSSVNGLVIYDGKYAFSNHASDPAGGQLCNAFDLVRVHRFGDLDREVDTGPITRMPSYTEMKQWAQGLPEVHRELIRGQLEEELDDSEFDAFAVEGDKEDGEEGGGEEGGGEEGGGEEGGGEDAEADQGWVDNLQATEGGVIKPTYFNASLIVQKDPKLNRLMRWNELSNKVETMSGRMWSTIDSLRVRHYVGYRYQVDFPEQKIEQAIDHHADRRKYHPVKEYLKSLEWDGVERVQTLFIDYFGCEDNAYTRDVSECWVTAAVSRVFEPGYKFDTTLVISGPQGIGKTTFIRELGKRKWYGELSSFDVKIAIEEIMGKWIIEIPEMAATNRYELERQKAFLSGQSTTTRLAYERRSVEYNRQCVFFASTNLDEYLKDSTGNRRWLPLVATVKKVDTKKLRREVDQIWAEGYGLWAEGRPTFLSPEAQVIALKEQKDKLESDPWTGVIFEWLEEAVYSDRYAWGGGFYEEAELEKRDRVCVQEVWEDCLKMPKTRPIKKLESHRIGAILTTHPHLQKQPSNMRFGKRFGRQKAWVFVRN